MTGLSEGLVPEGFRFQYPRKVVGSILQAKPRSAYVESQEGIEPISVPLGRRTTHRAL